MRTIFQIRTQLKTISFNILTLSCQFELFTNIMSFIKFLKFFLKGKTKENLLFKFWHSKPSNFSWLFFLFLYTLNTVFHFKKKSGTIFRPLPISILLFIDYVLLWRHCKVKWTVFISYSLSTLSCYGDFFIPFIDCVPVYLALILYDFYFFVERCFGMLQQKNIVNARNNWYCTENKIFNNWHSWELRTVFLPISSSQ